MGDGGWMSPTHHDPSLRRGREAADLDIGGVSASAHLPHEGSVSREGMRGRPQGTQRAGSPRKLK